jgi:predicted hydrocarbon binding protein
MLSKIHSLFTGGLHTSVPTSSHSKDDLTKHTSFGAQLREYAKLPQGARFYLRLKDEVCSCFGVNVAALLLYRLGRKEAEEFYSIVVKDLANDKNDAYRKLEKHFSIEIGLGWIRIENHRCTAFVEIDNKREVYGEGGGAGCYFVRGLIQRFFELQEQKRFDIKEVRCRHKGSPVCEFVATPNKKRDK